MLQSVENAWYWHEHRELRTDIGGPPGSVWTLAVSVRTGGAYAAPQQRRVSIMERR